MEELRAQALERRLKALRVEYDGMVKEREAEKSLVKDLEVQVYERDERARGWAEENERLREHMRDQATELTTVQHQLQEARAALMHSTREGGDREWRLQQEVNKLKLNREPMERHVASLEKEAREKAAEMCALRDAANDTQSVLEKKVVELQAENEILSTSTMQLRLKLEDEEKAFNSEQVVALTQKIADARILFANQLQAQEKVSDLHRRNSERAEAALQEARQKIAQLEEQTHTQAEAFRSAQEESEAGAIKNRAALENEIEALTTKVRTLEAAGETTASMLVDGSPPEVDPSAPVSTVPVIPAAFRGMTVTAMYDRVVRAERELSEATASREELRLSLERVQKDLDARVPALSALQRDYRKVVNSHGEISKRLEEVILENDALKLKGQSEGDALEKAQTTAKDLKALNRDLSSQLQHLLKSGLERDTGRTLPTQRVNRILSPDEDDAAGVHGGMLDVEDMISSHLVTFDDIVSVQTKNAQLLRILRSLNRQQEEAETKHAKQVELEQIALREAMGELEAMRGDREATEQMVVGLVQQRDMYRAMLQEMDEQQGSSSTSAGESGEAVGGAGSPGKSAQVLDGEVKDLQWKLRQSEEIAARATARASRLEDTEVTKFDLYSNANPNPNPNPNRP